MACRPHESVRRPHYSLASSCRGGEAISHVEVLPVCTPVNVPFGGRRLRRIPACPVCGLWCPALDPRADLDDAHPLRRSNYQRALRGFILYTYTDIAVGGRMRRRDFITLLGSLATWPLAAPAQQAGMPVIGWLDPSSPEGSAKFVTAFREGLVQRLFGDTEALGKIERFFFRAASCLEDPGWPPRRRSPSTNTSSSRSTVCCQPG